MVWVLHGAYLWIVIHLLLRGAAALGIVSVSAATHALTVGAIGSLTLGMMTRTARGHTGRELRASKIETTAYVLLMIGVGTRVLVPLFLPGYYYESVLVSAALWTMAFSLYVWVFAPWLLSPRVDGKAG